MTENVNEIQEEEIVFAEGDKPETEDTAFIVNEGDEDVEILEGDEEQGEGK